MVPTAARKESEAFDNSATCGMGWTENRLCYEDDPAGLYVEESISPLEMYWDHSCIKKNLVGARRISRAREIPMCDAMQLFPGKTRMQLDAVWAEGGELDKSVKSVEQKRIRDSDSSGMHEQYDDNSKVLLVETQWFEREVFYVEAAVEGCRVISGSRASQRLIAFRRLRMTLNFELVRGNDRLQCDWGVWSDTTELATTFGWKPRSLNPMRPSLSKLMDDSNPAEVSDEDAQSLAMAIRECLWMLTTNKRPTRRQMASLLCAE